MIGALIVAASMAQAGYAADAATPCPAHNLEEIVRSYGRIWGEVSTQRGIGHEESGKIVTGLVNAYSCQASQVNQPALCSNLGSIQTEAAGLASAVCRERADAKSSDRRRVRFGFISFMLGKADRSVCRSTYALLSQREKPPFSEDAFCDAALAAGKAKGFASLCASLMGKGWSAVECRENFPALQSECRGSAEDRADCSDMLQVYRAVDAGDLSQCPKSYASVCRSKKSPAESTDCPALEQRTVKDYCALYRKAWARTGGAIGMTDADVKGVQDLNRKIREQKSSAQKPADEKTGEQQ